MNIYALVQFGPKGCPRRWRIESRPADADNGSGITVAYFDTKKEALRALRELRRKEAA